MPAWPNPYETPRRYPSPGRPYWRQTHTHRVTYDDEERGERGSKERSGEKGVPLYLPNAALVRGKRGKRDMRSEVMQAWFTITDLNLSVTQYTGYDGGAAEKMIQR